MFETRASGGGARLRRLGRCTWARTARRISGASSSLLLAAFAGASEAEPRIVAGAEAGIAEIEACVTQNLPSEAGELGFRVEAVDRTGDTTRSRATIRWRKDGDALAQIVLRVSEPAKTAGTALLIVDRGGEEPEFFLRLPEIPKVRRVRSRRLKGPVLGTDFSFEDLERFRRPIDRTHLELVGTDAIEGRAAWLLETRPEAGTSDYARVLTWVEQQDCLPVRIDLFDEGDRLRKRLRAPLDEIHAIASVRLPHVFIMEDLRRETRTTVYVERFETRANWPAGQFTRNALEADPAAAPR